MILLRQHDLKQTRADQPRGKHLSDCADAAGDPAAAVPPEIAEAAGRRERRNIDRRRWRAQADVRPAGAPRDDGHRSSTAGRRVRSIEAADGNGWRGTSTRRRRWPRSLRRAPPDERRRMPRRRQGDISWRRQPCSAFRSRIRRPTPGADGKPVVVMQMEVTEFEVTNLDAALFEIPEGMTAVTNGRELAKVDQRRERSEAGAHAPRSGAPPPKKAGVIRVGVPELANKTDAERRYARAAHAAHRRAGGTENGRRAARRCTSGRAECVRERSRLRLSAGRADYRVEGIEARQALDG